MPPAINSRTALERSSTSSGSLFTCSRTAIADAPPPNPPSIPLPASSAVFAAALLATSRDAPDFSTVLNTPLAIASEPPIDKAVSGALSTRPK